MTRNDWNPPEPERVDGCIKVLLTLVGGAALLAWIASPSLVRGASRSYELSLQERRAEIDRVVDSPTVFGDHRDDSSE